jgi:hypothetical protein
VCSLHPKHAGNAAGELGAGMSYPIETIVDQQV